MNDIILSPKPEANPAEQPGAPDIAVTGPTAATPAKTAESGCCSANVTADAKADIGGIAAPEKSGACAVPAAGVNETKNGGSCATSVKPDANSCATSELPAIAAARDSCASSEKTGKPSASNAN